MIAIKSEKPIPLSVWPLHREEGLSDPSKGFVSSLVDISV
jgi:hypothetical protein